MSKKDDSTFAKVVVALVLLAGFGTFLGVLYAVSALINAFVLIKLWNWFVIPTFELAALSYPVAIGISLLVTFLTYQYHEKPEKTENENKQIKHLFAVIFLRPVMVLFVGWCVQCFM